MRLSIITLVVSTLAWKGNAATTHRADSNCTPNCPPRPATPAQQRAILEEFSKTIYLERNATKALLNYMPENYIQHAPGTLSGRQNSIDSIGAFLSPSTVNISIINRSFDNNIAFFHLRADFVGAPQQSVIVDIFRLNGTCIMEHWDVMQVRDPNSINPLALF